MECGAALPMQILILLKTYYSCSHVHLLSLPATLSIKMHLTQFQNNDFFSYSLFFRCLCVLICTCLNLINFLSAQTRFHFPSSPHFPFHLLHTVAQTYPCLLMPVWVLGLTSNEAFAHGCISVYGFLKT